MSGRKQTPALPDGLNQDLVPITIRIERAQVSHQNISALHFLKKNRQIKNQYILQLVVIAFLSIAVCAQAKVTVRCDVFRGDVVQLSYDASDETHLVRGFALDITVDNGATIENVFDYKVGESTADDPGYGIFPGSSATPVADSSGCPEDTLPGLGTYGITLSMSSLYVGEVNAPLPQDDLLKFSVDLHGASSTNISISLNACRGGIVMEDFNPPEVIELMGCTLIHESRVYVDDNADGLKDGSNWLDAFNFLQDAVTHVSSDLSVTEIRIAQGVYVPDTNSINPTGNGDRNATFQLIKGVVLEGGYAGLGDPDPNSRNIVLYETILSGDINVPGNANDNSYHVVTGSGTDTTAVLDGFTITKGNADGSTPHTSGAGMYNDSGSPSVIHCTFSDNVASGGGGGMCNKSYSSPFLKNCTFIDNSAGHSGGGIYSHWYSSPTLTNCMFTANSAGSFGGGMHNDLYCDPNVINSTFHVNSSGSFGGAMSNNQSSPKVTNCILWGNSPEEIFKSSGSSPIVTYSNVQGGAGQSWFGTGCIDADPLFVNPNGADGTLGTIDDNLRLSIGSLCIDVGDNTAVTEPNDLDGNPRIVDGDCDDTATVDMGAYEFDFIYFGDFAGGCDVDLADFAVMAQSWQLANPEIDIAPYLDPDGVIDLKELLVLANNWLAGK